MKTPCQKIESSIIKQFRKEIWRPFVKALQDYKMIEQGDRVAVCISGGKDSMLLAKCIQEILRHGNVEFQAEYLVMEMCIRDRYIVVQTEFLETPVVFQ